MNYLYVCMQGAKISYQNRRIIVQKDKEILKSIPIEPIECIEIYGNVQMTTQVVQECLKYHINVGLYTAGGFYLGNVFPVDSPIGVKLVKAQLFREMDHDFRIGIAKRIIKAKINNQKVVLKRYSPSSSSDLMEGIRNLSVLEQRVNRAANIQEIMGIEGIAARSYFQCMGSFFENKFCFHKRTRKPACDPYNALINFGYAVLQNQIMGKLILRGFLPSIGFIHSSKEYKQALAYDMMEEWRPVIVDALAAHCLHAHLLREEHFVKDETGAVYLTAEGMKIYRRKIEDKYEAEMTYLKTNASISFRRSLKYQVDSMAKAILYNDYNLYVPCRIR